MNDIVIVIPARMASSRLPGKPLADIHGEPMIVHVWRRAMEAELGEVIVACAEQEIADAVADAGGCAVLTRADHPSGSDRVWEAVQQAAPEAEIVINLQGDLPTLRPEAVHAVLQPLQRNPDVDIATLAVRITDSQDVANPNIVKIAMHAVDGQARALYFSRAPIPFDSRQLGMLPVNGVDMSVPYYHHIGIYAYRRDALARFVSLPPGGLEQRERLEQLRAMEAGMRIDVAVVDDMPLGVDTPEDLEKARHMLADACVLS